MVRLTRGARLFHLTLRKNFKKNWIRLKGGKVFHVIGLEKLKKKLGKFIGGERFHVSLGKNFRLILAGGQGCFIHPLKKILKKNLWFKKIVVTLQRQNK